VATGTLPMCVRDTSVTSMSELAENMATVRTLPRKVGLFRPRSQPDHSQFRDWPRALPLKRAPLVPNPSPILGTYYSTPVATISRSR